MNVTYVIVKNLEKWCNMYRVYFAGGNIRRAMTRFKFRAGMSVSMDVSPNKDWHKKNGYDAFISANYGELVKIHATNKEDFETALIKVLDIIKCEINKMHPPNEFYWDTIENQLMVKRMIMENFTDLTREQI